MSQNESIAPEVFQEAFDRFIEVVRGKVQGYYAENFPTLTPDEIGVSMGRRYAKIITCRDNGTCRSAYCFVDKTNGDILKAATWKAPAKHARGNIFDEDGGAGAVDWCGAKYLR